MGNRIDNLVSKIKANPKGVRFSDLEKVCDHYFGCSRKSGGSHCVYKTPWPGDPRVNIQNDHGKAIEKLKGGL